MKKLIFLFSLFMFFSCATELPTLYNIDKEYNFFGIDFSKYSKAGFLITPEKYNDNYESIGLVTYELLPGGIYKHMGKKVNPAYGGSNTSVPRFIDIYKWIIDEVSLEQSIDSMYIRCEKMGADALVNFKLENHWKDYNQISNPTTVMGYKLSGFAIKRK